MSIKIERQAVTLSLDKELYQKYKKFCQEKRWLVSGQVELLIAKQMEEAEEGQDGK